MKNTNYICNGKTKDSNCTNIIRSRDIYIKEIVIHIVVDSEASKFTRMRDLDFCSMDCLVSWIRSHIT